MKMPGLDRARRKSEEGQTIMLVAASITVLLAMAALAIDVVSLYVARSEAQRAADAAALAGAKMFVASGLTSVSGATPPVLLSDVCASGSGTGPAANAQAAAAAQVNLIAGQPAAIKSIVCAGTANNPQITVTVQRTNLQIFFARIWSRAATTISATATAEAYNPSGSSTQISVAGIKPWLVPNCYPNPISTANGNWGSSGSSADCSSVTTTQKFIDSATGNVNNGGEFIGKLIELTRIRCSGSSSDGCGPSGGPAHAGRFYAMEIPFNTLGDPPAVCAASSSTCDYDNDSHHYGDNIACAGQYHFQCGQQIGPGSGGGFGNPDLLLFATGNTSSGNGYGQQTRDATRCLIHARSDGIDNDQDIYHPSSGGNPPVRIEGGDNNPSRDLRGEFSISRSDSVVTVPLYDEGPNPLCNGSGSTCSGTTKVVGFLQLGVTCSVDSGDTGCIYSGSSGGSPHVEAVILNAVGCDPASGGNAVTGSGTSPVPVRLIH